MDLDEGGEAEHECGLTGGDVVVVERPQGTCRITFTVYLRAVPTVRVPHRSYRREQDCCLLETQLNTTDSLRSMIDVPNGPDGRLPLLISRRSVPIKGGEKGGFLPTDANMSGVSDKCATKKKRPLRAFRRRR